MHDPQHLLPSRPGQSVILVVDDEVMVRNVARIILEKQGYFILAAADGEEALQIARKFPGAIDLVLSDINMPRIDGLQLMNKLLGERPGVKILLMSGQADGPAGGVAFLRKP